jgi:hypothetical protein
MRTSIGPVKALFVGSAPAAALGLLLGAAARPELGLEAPPPMEPAPAAYASFTAEPSPYAGQTPAYVYGTDWMIRRAAAAPPPEAEPEPIAETYLFAHYEAPEPQPQEVWAPPPTYPSIDGDILAGTEPAHPPPAAIEVASPEA